MLPRKKTGGDEGGGFEVRVIGGTRKEPRDGGEGNLEMGLRIGVGKSRDRARAASPADPVHRLEAAEEPVQARPMSEAGPAVPQEPDRRRKRRRGLGHWTAWMAGTTVVLAVAVVIGMTIAGKRRNAGRDAGRLYEFEPVTTLDSDHQYFLEHAGDLIVEAEGILDRYAAATTAAEVLPLVRDRDRVKERLESLWRAWGAERRFAPGEEIGSYIIDPPPLPAIGLSGRKGDFSRFEMVFVREGGQVKLDWEASEGIGEVQIADLQAGTGSGSGVVRAVVQPSTHFTAAFPEAEFRSYRLADASGDHFVWGFARQGSAVEAALNAEFNEGTVLMEKSSELRATLRLAAAPGRGTMCHEITEMLHKGWVSP